MIRTFFTQLNIIYMQ